MIRTIIKTHGGKWFLKSWLASHFPKNYTEMTYLEGCGGGGSLLLSKKPSVREIYNDLDWNLFNLFYVIRNHPEEMVEGLKDVNYTKETFEQASYHNSLDETSISAIKYLVSSAINEIILRRFSRGGLKKAFAWSERQRGGTYGDVNAWNTFKESLPTTIERLKNIEVTNMNVVAFMNAYDDSNAIVYLDPPYLPSTRRSPNAYSVEMTEKEHIELAETLSNVKAKVMLSGYQSALYMKLYKNWNLDTKVIANHSSQVKKKEKKIECVWKNY